MSPRISTTIAAVLAIAALPAPPAVAKSSKAVKTADESGSILKPSSGLGHVRSSRCTDPARSRERRRRAHRVCRPGAGDVERLAGCARAVTHRHTGVESATRFDL